MTSASIDEIPGASRFANSCCLRKTGQAVTLETVADVRDALMKVMIFRHDKQRAVKIVGDITQDAKLGDVRNRLIQTVRDENMLPPGYTLEFSGISEDMGEAIADFSEAILLATFLTLLTLAAMLESFRRMFLVSPRYRWDSSVSCEPWT